MTRDGNRRVWDSPPPLNPLSFLVMSATTKKSLSTVASHTHPSFPLPRPLPHTFMSSPITRVAPPRSQGKPILITIFYFPAYRIPGAIPLWLCWFLLFIDLPFFVCPSHPVRWLRVLSTCWWLPNFYFSLCGWLLWENTLKILRCPPFPDKRVY